MPRLLPLVALLLLGPGLPAQEQEPTTAQGWYRRGAELLGQGKFAEAIASLTKCLDLNADHADALDARGSANFMAGKFAASVTDFDRYLRLHPDKANGHWRRGISLYYA